MKSIYFLFALVLLVSIGSAYAPLGTGAKPVGGLVAGNGYIVAECVNDENDRAQDCEQGNVFTGSGAYGTMSGMPPISTKNSIPAALIMQWSACGESASATYSSNTYYMTSPVMSVDTEEYCWRDLGQGWSNWPNFPHLQKSCFGSCNGCGSGDCWRADYQASNDWVCNLADDSSLFTRLRDKAGVPQNSGSTSVHCSYTMENPAFGFMGSDPRATSNQVINFPTSFSCEQLYLEVIQNSHTDWPSAGSYATASSSPGGSVTLTRSANSNTISARVYTDSGKHITRVEWSMVDLSANAGGAAAQLWCLNPGVCGDNSIQWPEQCDGSSMPAYANCQTQGYASGTAVCTGACQIDYSSCNQCGNGVCDVSESTISCPADCVGLSGTCPAPTVWNSTSSLCEQSAPSCGGPFWLGAPQNCMMEGGPSAGCTCCGGLDGASGTCTKPACGFSGVVSGWGSGSQVTEGRQCGVAVNGPGMNGYYCTNNNLQRFELTPANNLDGRCCPDGYYWNGANCVSSVECTQPQVGWCGAKATTFGIGDFLNFMHDPICVGIAGTVNKPAGLSACGDYTPPAFTGQSPFYWWTDWVGTLRGAQTY